MDVNDERLSLAVKMGADVVVNSTKIKDLREELMRLTGGDGFSRSVMKPKATEEIVRVEDIGTHNCP